MFNLGSYNSRGLPKTKKDLLLGPDVLSVLLNNDVTCIQETCFSKRDLSNLTNLHNDYHGIICTLYQQSFYVRCIPLCNALTEELSCHRIYRRSIPESRHPSHSDIDIIIVCCLSVNGTACFLFLFNVLITLLIYLL